MRGCRASQAPGVWDSLKTLAGPQAVSQDYSGCLLELSKYSRQPVPLGLDRGWVSTLLGQEQHQEARAGGSP